jgi:PhoPQ-activated pathogenicity-related protein
MAIIPIVIDLLNVVPSFNHHWKCYGEWSYAVDSYVNEGIMEWMGSKEFDQMLSVMEPYNYIDQLDLPKFLINATGDEFFVTDSWQFYWNDLKGDKHLQYIPNTSHGLKNTEGDYDLKSLTAFYKAVITDTELPNYEWHVSQDSIFLKVDHNNYAVKQWEAVNKETRDFRVDTIDRTWVSETLQQSEDGSYAVKISQPETGYKAGLLEITFNPDSDIPYIFTTGTVVSPNTFPFGDFKSENPKGTR